MIEITEITISKNPVYTKGTFKISVEITETVDFPYDHTYDYPISYTGVGKPADDD